MKLFIKIILCIYLCFSSLPVEANEDGIGFQVDMLPWEKVNTLLPKYSKFTVMDVETGKTFKVQRRAGSHHADVQPLNARETKIMKEIYSGKWSWKRRAIIVIHKDQWIAGSMHGMPHGAGALNNNFPGHFCIHFYGSTTHRTNFMDLSHKLMILKAAGKLKEYAAVSDSYEITSAFIAGLKQQDETILSTFSLQQMSWRKYVKKIENIKLNQMTVLPVQDLLFELSVEIPVEIEFVTSGSGRRVYRGNVHLIRFSYIDAWKIDSIRFLKDTQLSQKSIKKT